MNVQFFNSNNCFMIRAILIFSILLNCYLFVCYSILRVRIGFAASHVETFLMVAREQSPENAAECIRSYYLPGTILAEGSQLSEIVEVVRHCLLRQIEQTSGEKTETD